MSEDTKGQAKKKALKAPKNKPPERIKCSLLLSRENDLRLTVLASLKGYRDRSRLLNELLDASLRGVVVSLRGAMSEGAGEGGPIPEGDETTEAA